MVVTEYKLKAKIKKPMCFAVVADFHNGSPDKIISILKKVNPDIILMPGDLFHRRKNGTENAEILLNEAVKIAPLYFSPGNHEQLLDEEEKNMITSSGAVLLDNSEVLFGDIRIGGLSSGFGDMEQGHFKKTPPPDEAFIRRFSRDDGHYRLLLCHHPEYYPEYLKNTPIEMILSGHAHGGQVRLFGRGLFAPGQGFFPKYTSGVHDGRLIISRGVTNSAGVPRLFNPTEVVIIRTESDE